MSWVTALAIYFIIWWTALFAILPVGIRSQHEDDDVVLGTDHGAPSNFSFWRKAFWTTVVSTAIFAVYCFVTETLGFGVDSLPTLFPPAAG
jgi:predicted secreted protein